MIEPPYDSIYRTYLTDPLTFDCILYDSLSISSHILIFFHVCYLAENPPLSLTLWWWFLFCFLNEQVRYRALVASSWGKKGVAPCCPEGPRPAMTHMIDMSIVSDRLPSWEYEQAKGLWRKWKSRNEIVFSVLRWQRTLKTETFRFFDSFTTNLAEL